jgi:membrane-bound lytic murein transglycosylase F
MKRALLLSCLALASCVPPDEQPPPLYVATGDLPEIRQRGTLRILVPSLREENLSRQGAPGAEDREMAILFAERLGLRCEFGPVESRSGILDLLERGYGDVVTAGLTVTPARERRFRFTRPNATVDEWLVGRRGDPGLPRSVEALEGREIHVRRSSSFAETLSELAGARGIGLRLVYVGETVDTETIAYEVSRGERPLTVVDSNLLSTIETYNPDLERLFVIAEGRDLAWVVRREAVELASALDAFIIERYLTSHRTEDRTREGLEAIRARGSLRVITLNDSAHYFLYRGRQMGFDYEIGRLAAKRLGVRLEMVVPPRRDLIRDWLLEGRGDVVASTLTVRPEREDRVAFSRPYLFQDELVVQAAAAAEKIGLEELEGRTIHAWRSSSHYERLIELQDEYGPFRIELIPEDMELDEILSRVASGEFPLAVVDGLLAAAEIRRRQDVRVAFSLSSKPREVAFAVRRENQRLKEFLDEFASQLVGSLDLNDARARYFFPSLGLVAARERTTGGRGRLTPYDEIFQKYSRQYGLDWRLLAAQAYQESRFDPTSRSWAGATGLFQILPSTAVELGFENVENPEAGIQAGTKLMHLLLERLDPRLELKHRLRFALAAYNAGWGHLQDARRLAAEQGLDPDRWFGQTEKAMLLLSQPRYHQRARHGYVRGGETVAYVSQIQNRYDHYVALVPF